MPIASLIDAITTTLDETARRGEDGYFGWTDRYGVRPSFAVEGEIRHVRRRPYFIANY